MNVESTVIVVALTSVIFLLGSRRQPRASWYDVQPSERRADDASTHLPTKQEHLDAISGVFVQSFLD